jgi:hypothetical protein
MTSRPSRAGAWRARSIGKSVAAGPSYPVAASPTAITAHGTIMLATTTGALTRGIPAPKIARTPAGTKTQPVKGTWRVRKN